MARVETLLRTLICGILAGSTGVAAAQEQLELNPQWARFLFDGIESVQPYLNAKDGHVVLSLPRHWELISNDNALRLSSTKHPNAYAIVSIAEPPLPINTEEATEITEAAAMAALPGEAKNVALQVTNKDILPINQWKSIEQVFRYELPGQTYQYSQIALNLKNGLQLRLEVWGDLQDFDQARTALLQLMETWAFLDPEVFQELRIEDVTPNEGG